MRVNFRKLNSFESPEKTLKNFYCNCKINPLREFACTNGLKWIDSCFEHYDYSQLLRSYHDLIQISSTKEIVSDETEKQIQKDLLRTFQKVDLFATQNMKNKLMRILKALVAYDPCNGYTQGMNFIAAALIVHCEESTTFWLCTCLLEKYEIREVY